MAARAPTQWCTPGSAAALVQMPRLLYLDQKDISNLAKLKVDSAARDELLGMVATDTVAVVMSSAHIIETALLGHAALRSQITGFVDAELRPSWWLYDFEELAREEVAICLNRDYGGRPEPLRPFHSAPLTSQFHVDPGTTFSAAVECARAHHDSKASTFWDNLERYAGSRERGRAQCDNDPIPKANIRDFIYESMPTRTATGMTLTSECRRVYANELDVNRCPAISLWIAALETKSHDKQRRITRSEAPDLLHLTAVPYCDVTTLDAEMYSVVFQHGRARRFSDRIARNVCDAVERLHAPPR